MCILGDLVPADKSPAIRVGGEIPIPKPANGLAVFAWDTVSLSIQELGIVARSKRRIPALPGGMDLITHLFDLAERLRVSIRIRLDQ